MQRSKIEVFLHYVWTTHHREPFLAPQIERAVHRCIAGEAKRLRCIPLAVNGMPDHVHLVVQMHSTVSIARLAQAVKGVSSLFANTELGFDGAFDRQDNYAAFSVGSELDAVLGYARHQKQHHGSGDIWPEWKKLLKMWSENSLEANWKFTRAFGTCSGTLEVDRNLTGS